jgi:hypothetical protein
MKYQLKPLSVYLIQVGILITPSIGTIVGFLAKGGSGSIIGLATGTVIATGLLTIITNLNCSNIDIK